MRKKIISLLLISVLVFSGANVAYASDDVSATEETENQMEDSDVIANPVEEGTVDETSSVEDQTDISGEEEIIQNGEDNIVTMPMDESLEVDAVTDIIVTTVNAAAPEPITFDEQENYIIVLDPGHGGVGTGASRDWGSFVVDEATINFKISNYTKEYLEANYDAIEVYLTKATLSENPSLANRVAFAVGKNADIFVSQHVNSTSTTVTTANGVLAMVPTVDASHSYNQEAALISQTLARRILDELVILGFKDMGFQYRLSGDNTLYPDGSLADYYGIVRRCRENNLPGTIIEHGFCNNESDALKLSDEAMLKKMGEADARGIAEYLGLKEKQPEEEPVIAAGDVNDDGKLSLLDVILLRKYIADNETVINLAMADMNADGKIGLLDIILLRKEIANQ